MGGVHSAAGSVSRLNVEDVKAIAGLPHIARVEGNVQGNALLVAANTNTLLGVTRHSHAYAKTTELGTSGLKPGVTLAVHTEGPIWVVVDETVVVGDAVRVRGDTNGGTVPGVFCKTTSAGHTYLLKNARWLKGSVTLADGTKAALVDINMAGIGTATSE